MYGYVRPRKGELRVRELEQYQAAYCGLCHQLGKRYSLPARFLVNYDLTFLYCLLTGCQQPQPLTKRRCPANPFVKKTCAGPDDAMAYTADLCVLLGWHKLADAARDGGFGKRLGAGLAKALLRSSFRRAETRQPEAAQTIRARLESLNRLEAQQSASLDRAADTFAAILAAAAGWFDRDDQRRAGEQLLYHVGRFVYLCDAWDDLKSDAKTGQYNPVALRYAAADGILPEAQAAQLRTTLNHSVRLAAAALELLPLRWGKGLLENIIYLGLPAVLDSIADGTFHTNRDRSTV